jgi:hypothetical protein
MGSCEHVDEIFCSIKDVEFLLTDERLLDSQEGLSFMEWEVIVMIMMVLVVVAVLLSLAQLPQ